MSIRLEQFSGLTPKLSGELLPPSGAAVADSCSVADGKVVPLRGHTHVADVALGTKTIYRYGNDWLSWLNDVDVIASPVSNDAHDRIYYSGDGEPRVRGVVGAEVKTFLLGIPAPVDIPVVEALAKDEVTWTREWKYQYEEPDGTITQEDDLVGVVEVIPGQSYTLALIPAKDGGPSAEAVFVAYFDSYTDSAVPTYLGRVYPGLSLYNRQTDLYVDGALVSMAQVNSVGATFDLSFDTSRASDYVKERVYVFTFITAFGEESAPSFPTELLEVSPVQNAKLTGLPNSAPQGYSNVITKRIYRTETTAAGTLYRMVADVGIGTTEFTDDVISAELLGVLDTADWQPPPAAMKGLTVTAGGVCVGFTGRTIHFSEPYFPHAWPAKYEFESSSEVVAVKATESGVVVLTKDRPEVIQGDTPSTMQRLRMPVAQGCASKRSAVIYRGGVVYATPDGIGMISGLTHTMLSDPFFERDDWQELDPEEMIGAVHNQELLLYSPTTSLISDLKDGLLVSDSSTKPTAFYSDPDTDTLYLVDGTAIKTWRTGKTGTARWRTRTYSFPRPLAPFEIQVQATAYPVTVRFIAEGETVLEMNLTSEKVRKLPVMRRTERWAFETEATGNIHRLHIGIAGGSL